MTALLLVLLLLGVVQGYILKCLISPDVQQLATTSSDKTVKLWNLDGFTLDRWVLPFRASPLRVSSPREQRYLSVSTEHVCSSLWVVEAVPAWRVIDLTDQPPICQRMSCTSHCSG